jgi:dipeptidyl aminopeptidase/acylaminoacyl peptidase
MRRRYCHTALVRSVLSLLTCLSASMTRAGEKSMPLSVNDALTIHLFGDLSPVTFSPDGKWIAYVVLDNQRPKSEKLDAIVRTGVISRAEGDIWISNAETGEAKNLTGEKGSNWKPTWSPDGHYLAFFSDRDGSGQAKLWIWNSIHQELRLASALPIRARYSTDQILWSPDSQKILVTTAPQDLALDVYVKKILAPPATPVPDTIAASGSTVILYRNDPSWDEGVAAAPMFNLDKFNLRDLVLIDITTGKVDTVVRGRRIERYSLSPDGRKLLYAIPKRFYKPGWYRRVFDLRILNLATSSDEILASDVLLDVFQWSPDGSRIAYSTHNADEKSFGLFVAEASNNAGRQLVELPYDRHEGLELIPMWGPEGLFLYFVLDGALWKTSVSDGTSVELCRIPGQSIEYVISRRDGELWAPDGGRSSLVVAHDDEEKQDAIYRINLDTGGSTRLQQDGHCYTCGWPATSRGSFLTTASRDGQSMAYVAEDAQNAPELWVADPGFLKPKQLTHLNPQLEKYKMGVAQAIEWLSEDGERLRGALLLPSNYHPGQKYPLIVWVYPGALLSNDRDQFGFGERLGPLNMQLFATRGYVVLFPDAIDKAGDRMRSLAKSVLPGINKVIELGIADPQRVGLMGHSQGGFAALALLVQSNRFKAAIVADGWGDSTSWYGVMYPDGTGYQYGQAERQLGGAPWQYPLTYLENSPVYYLDKVETPLLLVHGTEDGDLPSFLADEIFSDLRRLGKQVEYAKYEGQPHVPIDWTYANQVDLANRVIQWFAAHLGGEGSEAREAPRGP